MIIYNQLKTFRFQSSFKTWLYRVTANCALNFAKKAAKHRHVTDEQVLMHAAIPSDIPDKVDNEHQQRVVTTLLASLNPDQRACVVLREMQGLDYQQIASSLRININTVRTRLKRAREKMMALGKKVYHETM